MLEACREGRTHRRRAGFPESSDVTTTRPCRQDTAVPCDRMAQSLTPPSLPFFPFFPVPCVRRNVCMSAAPTPRPSTFIRKSRRRRRRGGGGRRHGDLTAVPHSLCVPDDVPVCDVRRRWQGFDQSECAGFSFSDFALHLHLHLFIFRLVVLVVWCEVHAPTGAGWVSDRNRVEEALAFSDTATARLALRLLKRFSGGFLVPCVKPKLRA